MTKPTMKKHHLILIEPNFFTLDELIELIWNEADIEDYKHIAVKLNDKRIIFGSWLYTQREGIQRGNFGIQYHVNDNSLDLDRKILINGAISYLYNMNTTETRKGNIASTIEKLIKWLNHTQSKTPTNINEARVTYRDFTAYLQQVVKTYSPDKKNHKIDENTFGMSTANKIQNTILTLLSKMLNVEYEIIKGLTPTIPKSDSPKKDIEIDQEGLDESLSYYYQFFEQVADFCLENKPYPYKIKLLEHKALLIPQYERSGSVISEYDTGQMYRNKFWDLENGVLRNELEIVNIVKTSDTYINSNSKDNKNKMISHARRTRKKKLKLLNEVNSNPSNQYRLEIGLRAIKAYFMVLLDITSMNDSTLANIKWDNDDFTEETSTSIKLRNIKKRSGNKEVVFTIQNIFVGSFRKFLKLRRFVLDGNKDINTLFFVKTGEHASLGSTYKTGHYGANAYQSFQSIYPKIKYFGSQKQRQNAKVWSMKKTKGQVFLVSAWLQHTTNVSEQHYPSESRSESQNQMGNYLNLQHKVTMELKDEQLSSVGGCDSLDPIPQNDSEITAVKPDCQKKITCLFCQHYRIKPIAEEIHKLISMEYVINRHSILHARSQVQFDTVMGPVLERANMFKQAMKSKYPDTGDIIDQVEKDVYDNQNLHWFWEKRLELLWELGWV